MLAQLVSTFPCKRCGAKVRLIALTTGGYVTIDIDPSADGRIIPWPSPEPTGITMGRVMTELIGDEQGWSQHECG